MAAPVFRILDRKLPQKAKTILNNYSLMGNSGRSSKGWTQVIKVSLGRTIVFAICSVALILLSFKFLSPFMQEHLQNVLSVKVINIINCAITLLLLSPFLLGLIRHGSHTQAAYSKLWRENKFNRIVIVAWTLLRIFGACVFVILVLSKYFKFTGWVVVIIALAIVLFISFSRRILNRYVKIEQNFMHNLNAKEEQGMTKEINR